MIDDANIKSIEVRDEAYFLDRAPIRRSTIMARATPIKQLVNDDFDVI